MSACDTARCGLEFPVLQVSEIPISWLDGTVSNWPATNGCPTRPKAPTRHLPW
jgi:hypothetical protein